MRVLDEPVSSDLKTLFMWTACGHNIIAFLLILYVYTFYSVMEKDERDDIQNILVADNDDDADDVVLRLIEYQ